MDTETNLVLSPNKLTRKCSNSAVFWMRCVTLDSSSTLTNTVLIELILITEICGLVIITDFDTFWSARRLFEDIE